MPFVVDASIALSWAFPDEADARADRALAQLEHEAGVAPALWWYEVRNALIAGERRNRLDPVATTAFLRQLAWLPITLDRTPDETAALDLARRHKLSIYDAVYLELAGRLSAPLATCDVALTKAARAERIGLIEAKIG
ncbi:MAG: type II toxin-antitoxin system VapC family toxin [Methylocella sp.]